MSKMIDCNFAIYKDIEFGLKDKVCLIIELDKNEEEIDKLAQKLTTGLEIEFPAIKEDFNRLLQWEANYYSHITPFQPYITLLSKYEFVLERHDTSLIGRIEKRNLKRFGIKSLFELDEMKHNIVILLTAYGKDTSSPKKVHFIRPSFVQKKLRQQEEV